MENSFSVDEFGIDGFSDVSVVRRSSQLVEYTAVDSSETRRSITVFAAEWDNETRRHFNRERRQVSSITNDGVVPMLRSGSTSAGFRYVVTPFYADSSIQSRLGVEVDQAVRYVTNIGRILAAVHAEGITHRNVVPSNIMVAENGSARLNGFGNYFFGGTELLLSVEDAYGFYPPEVFADNSSIVDLDVASVSAGVSADVYGLGATLWALIAGRAPFTDPAGDSDAATIKHRVANESVESLGQLAPWPIKQAIDVAMSKNPQHRYSSIVDFLEAVNQPTSYSKTRTSDPDESDSSAVEAETGFQSEETAVFSSGDVNRMTVAKKFGSLTKKQEREASHSKTSILATSEIPRSEQALLEAEPKKVEEETGLSSKKWATALLGLVAIIGISAVATKMVQPGLLEASPDVQGEHLKVDTTSKTDSTQPAVTEPIELNKVPTVTELPVAKATELLAEAGFQTGQLMYLDSDEVEKGAVIEAQVLEKPAPSDLELGTVIDLIVSNGPASIVVPPVSGLEDEVVDQLNEVGLLNVEVSTENSKVPKGQVVSVQPGVGRVVTPETLIQVIVSKGVKPASTPVPEGVPSLPTTPNVPKGNPVAGGVPDTPATTGKIPDSVPSLPPVPECTHPCGDS